MLKKEIGFSLIEALVVVGVIAILGLVLMQLLTNTLKGGNKTQVIGAIKQNGQVALNTIDSTVRSANDVICPDKNVSSNVLVTVKNGLFTRFWFVTSSNNSTDGYIAMDDPSISDPTTYKNLCCNNSTNSCANGFAPTTVQNLTAPGSVSLLPTSPQFTRSSSSGHADLLNIQFDLGPSVKLNGSAQNQVGTNNSVHFSDSVELR